MTDEQIKEFTRRTAYENHSGLMLVLRDMELVYITDAQSAYGSDSDSYMRSVEKAKSTLNELISCFCAEDINARRVISVLRFIYGRLVASSVKRAPQDLDECKRLLDRLAPLLDRLHELDTDGPVMKNTHRVYAGLTYGKGTLNESTIGVDYSSRGFKI